MGSRTRSRLDRNWFDPKAEWLEADGLGGFASGTVSGVRTRRYHALLLAATTPPAGRFLLVNGFDAWVKTSAGTFPVSSQLYAPDVFHPDGKDRVESFEPEPWPRWRFRLEDGTRLEQQILVQHGAPVAAVCWRLLKSRPGVTLLARPFLSGRDPHALHRENPGFRFDPQQQGNRQVWKPYAGVPGIIVVSNGEYAQQPCWYRNFLYEEERARGLDFIEDLASPGIFRWDLTAGEAVWIFGAEGLVSFPPKVSARTYFKNLRSTEQRRRRFPSRLHRAADAYRVRRASGKTIMAGYPWFGDWGRDTFIALRGLCLTTGRFEDARQILTEWAGAVSEGMLPNRFPDRGQAPEYNSVDASLWYVIAVYEFLRAVKGKKGFSSEQKTLQTAAEAILSGYSKGTRFRIRMDEDGLLCSGEPGVQLAWMDAKVGDWVVTPRIGKPVEVQALWLNALWVGSRFSGRWEAYFERGLAVFQKRFWNENGGFLYDVVDPDHQAGAADATFRPNQIFAVGGLPLVLLEPAQARSVVEAVEKRLWTPMGLRSLAPGEPGYAAHYAGGVRERDGAYHQGTVWPWLIGPFVEGWVRVRGSTAVAKKEARARFLEPLLRHLDEAGLGHISEIADAEPPHRPNGCPFQAWSVSEALRLQADVLAENKREKR